MKRLGRILRVTRRNMILARSKVAPTTDAKVYDSRGKFIGKVYDVFGPISNPYVLIRVENEELNVKKISKKTVYFYDEKLRRNKSWRRRKRG
ncbi:MAG TPA: hypothetical protein ENG81_03700 [Candidatus Bathyarchaeota archaeon]|nr:hypothetical protein [Candidatus Bathyarchaeota archaeon]